jgi:hypothetical protein
MEPHQPWPALPPGPERLPFHEWIILKGHASVETATHSDDPIEVQSLGGVTDGKQLWFRPREDKGWLEVRFETQTNQIGELTARMVHSYDYGIYRVLLDGAQIAQVDLYDPQIVPAAERLGMQTLKAGTHTLRFECAGKSSKSAGYFLGFDALAVRVPVYSRPSNVDLRTIQKHK